MGVYVTPIHTAEQADYRLAGSCGEDRVAAADVAVEYRLGLSQGQDPIVRLGSGWKEFDRTPGTVLATAEDVEEMRQVVAGRDPRTGQRLVKFKTATSPDALLPARPLVEAVDKAAAEYGVSVQELLWRLSWAEDATRPRPTTSRSRWSWDRYNRLLRCLTSEGEHHRAPVADLTRIATAAGVDLETVYDAVELGHAQDHADERVDIGTRAYDVVFTRDRRTDAAQAAAPPEAARRMEQIHDEAVGETVAHLERWVGYVMVGHHGDGQQAQRVDATGIIATATKHRTARAMTAGEPGDPHTHTHVMISVMGRSTVDGKWRTIAAGGRDLMRHVSTLGEMQRAIERRKLTEEFGFRYAQDPESRQWELVGIPDVVKNGFSRRRNQARAEVGADAPGAVSRAAARRTAEKKVASTRSEERASWHKRMREMKFPPAVLWRAALQGREPGAEGPAAARGPRPDLGPNPDAVAAAVWDPETGVTANHKVASRARVMAAVAAACEGGIASGEELEVLTAHVLEHPMALRLPDLGATHMSHSARYTAADLPEAEATILDTAEAGKNAQIAIVDRDEAARALKIWQQVKGFHLSREQLTAVVRLIEAGHALDTVLGGAGTGKTTLMSAARCAWEAAGFRVEGAAVAAVAAAGLRAEAGITSRTIASWRQRITGGPGLRGVDVLVVDEGAMVGDRDMAALVREAAKRGTKIVSIGDPLQLRPVAAGSVFARLHHRMGGAELRENRRQKDTADRQALQAWGQGARKSALALWAQRGMVHAPVDADAAHAQMAAAWTADRARYANPLDAVEKLFLVAATKADVDALNLRAAQAARAAGHLGKELTFATRSGDLALALGEQVRVRRNDYRSRNSEEPDVLNGYRGVVAAVDAQLGALVVWGHGKNERAWISPKQIRRGDLGLGYATTIASAQGVTTDRCHVYGLGADAHALYPAMSRAKVRTDLYLPGAEIEPHTTRARLGEAATAEEALERVVSAYLSTLTQDEDRLLIDELEQMRPTEPAIANGGQEPEHNQEDESRPVPEHERLAAKADALIRRANQLEAGLPALREELRLAEERAQLSRMRLLVEGATPHQVRATVEEVREKFHEVADAARTARGQGAELARRAKIERGRHEQQQAQEARLLAAVEPLAVERGLTRADLRALPPEQLQGLQARVAAHGVRAAWHGNRRPMTKVGGLAPAPTRTARPPRTPTQPTPKPPSPSQSRRPSGPGMGR
ncbi:MobF family relaxase [Nocardiopsis sp. JB363]|uniref:MobF family relaxase n=1 Tax=Nocardiopsis sp. JB363 TaxID=1434837 RepID=UPI00097A441A|nr:MobF family relaxase [Nocardiopsis sp. JB363]SIO84615.1 Conjugal transfer protein TraA [Nocardiopsis sp. JB363]